MIKIYLCDDNASAVIQHTQLLTEVAERNHIDITITSFSNGEELLFHLCETPDQSDIIYLDILMKPINGINIAKELRKHGCTAEIIFLTTSEDYVYDSFEVSPIQYLLKETLSEQKFEEVFLRAVELSSKRQKDIFSYDVCGTKRLIPINEISFFEIWKRIIMVHYSDDKTDKFYGQMEQLETQLKDRDFIRVHRSFLIHLPYIVKFEAKKIILKTGAAIPIGVTFTASVQQAFSDYLSRSNIISFE